MTALRVAIVDDEPRARARLRGDGFVGAQTSARPPWACFVQIIDLHILRFHNAGPFNTSGNPAATNATRSQLSPRA